MVKHPLLRYPRCLAIVLASLLTVVAIQTLGPIAHASSASPFHIELTVLDPASGGPITQNDTLKITAKVFENGVRARSGEIFISATSPSKRYLCEIDTFPYSRDTCQTHLPKTGLWHIVARLTSTIFPPWRYVATASISLNVFSEVTATTQPTSNAQLTDLSLVYADLEIGGQYYPTPSVTISVPGTDALSPDGGYVNFYDGVGELLCTVPVGSDPTVDCYGPGFASPPPLPFTAEYTGTTNGFDDGFGLSYAPASASYD